MNEAAVKWLREQIAARLGTAQAAMEGTDGRWEIAQDGVFAAQVPPGQYTKSARIVYGEGLEGTPPFDHIVLNDPRQVIADCEAQLAIFDSCVPSAMDAADLRHLASTYRHHPGYAEHWGVPATR